MALFLGPKLSDSELSITFEGRLIQFPVTDNSITDMAASAGDPAMSMSISNQSVADRYTDTQMAYENRRLGPKFWANISRCQQRTYGDGGPYFTVGPKRGQNVQST